MDLLIKTKFNTFYYIYFGSDSNFRFNAMIFNYKSAFIPIKKLIFIKIL